MEFLIPSGLQPSASLYMEYAQSVVTIMLNTLQTREFYNEMFKKYFEDRNWTFKENNQMSEKCYDKLKEKYIKKVSYLYIPFS